MSEQQLPASRFVRVLPEGPVERVPSQAEALEARDKASAEKDLEELDK